jgi:hypothetical protein
MKHLPLRGNGAQEQDIPANVWLYNVSSRMLHQSALHGIESNTRTLRDTDEECGTP